MATEKGEFGVISVVFETRADGGLRVYSDDIPGFALSHQNRDLVLSDVQPALETIIGEIIGQPVKVEPCDESSAFSWGPHRHSRKYNAPPAGVSDLRGRFRWPSAA